MTKESSGNDYHVKLAREIASILEKALKVHSWHRDDPCRDDSLSQDTNGVMTVSDAFCRVNRARGYEVRLRARCGRSPDVSIRFQLISPEDLLNAAAHMERLGLPVRYEVASGEEASIDPFLLLLLL